MCFYSLSLVCPCMFCFPALSHRIINPEASSLDYCTTGCNILLLANTFHAHRGYICSVFSDIWLNVLHCAMQIKLYLPVRWKKRVEISPGRPQRCSLSKDTCIQCWRKSKKKTPTNHTGSIHTIWKIMYSLLDYFINSTYVSKAELYVSIL